MFRTLLASLLATAVALPALAQDDHARYRALFKEFVETNTTLSAGSCTALAAKIAGHLKEAGYPDSDLHPFSVPDHPKEGGLVAVLPGSDPKAKPILLLGHLDVVEAKREDWTRDPFTLIEENGQFYGRGVADMKSLDAAWVDTMMRLKQEGFKHRRTIKLALTCGEETASAFNGAKWLAANQRELIDAEFALNEGGGGRLGRGRQAHDHDGAGGGKIPPGLYPGSDQSRRPFQPAGEEERHQRAGGGIGEDQPV